ncbi:hypothetical protein CEUSTIGMA_g49.t1 [Chlamydomonas eustigma]|uniref:MIF4G domain-containing protein n=1 Tax=Chlamydomonas eustigma TaxID=1157962 RepID=A0A250WP45_9CHLO|nr:hypothetical protein CEUSTIGMA_g49.t1 [Chlamydomonas eustigma]|eukprot:GAX72593.1 hypothetical protein CEUSTIGMA_g49.t1 [Chlamydomonas eustigma]
MHDRREYGGGYHRDNRRGRGGGAGTYKEHNFQKSFVGSQKRGRDEDVHVPDPKNVMILKLMSLGDKLQGHAEDADNVESAFEDAIRLCKREINFKNDELIDIMLECIFEVPTKTPYYALLTGLLNVDEHDFVSRLVRSAHDSFEKAVLSGELDKARLLLRFLASLVVVQVLNSSGVLALMQGIVASALNITEACAHEDPTGCTWQPWCDQLVNLVIAALPWSGYELSESAPHEVSKLMNSIESYMAARPSKEDGQMRPFFGDLGPDDLAGRSDSGSSSYLSDVWEAVKECQLNDWKVASIPQVHSQFESKVAQGTSHELPPHSLDIPVTPSFLGHATADSPKAVLAALLRKAIPSRGGLRLLGKERTEGNRPAIERWVAEEYILDTLASFEGNRVECVKRLVSGLPLAAGWEHQALLAEVLFGQMLALPEPKLHLMAYGTIIVDLCKIPKFDFTRPLSGCVRELFSRLPNMDPELRTRLVNWLSYHLSNFDYTWPWDRWSWVSELPPEAAQRQFCTQLLGRLVRLSYWQRIQQVLPDTFKQLLGPEPEVPDAPGTGVLPGGSKTKVAVMASKPALSSLTSGGGQGDKDGDAQMEETEKGAEEETEAKQQAQSLESKEGSGAEEGAGRTCEVPSRVSVWAGELLGFIRQKVTSESALEWLEEHVVTHSESMMDEDDKQGHDNEEAATAKAQLMLQVAMRAVLAAGSKTPSHLSVALERYSSLLSQLMKNGGAGVQQVLLREAAIFYRQLPQKLLMVVDRLMALHLLEVSELVTWSLHAAAEACDDGYTKHCNIDTSGKEIQGSGSDTAVAWEVLYYGLQRAGSRLPQVKEKQARKEEEVEALRKKVLAAAERASIESDAMPVPGPGNEAEIRRVLARVEAANNEEKLLEVKLQQAEAELELCSKASDNTGVDASSALLATYSCFKNILHRLELQAHKTQEAAVAATAEAEEAGPAGGEHEEAVEGDGQERLSVAAAALATATAAAAAERLELWYQQLRVFVRRFRVESSDVVKQLQELMKSSRVQGEDNVPTPDRMIHELTSSLLMS